ncbi:EndoU domain-containing protein [Nocardia sp. NPDC057030]|uniref:EndoU domain-containing protein n=1 Tax=unclassified Nocardia TaxID=2637762 RepID=UPI0036310BB6
MTAVPRCPGAVDLRPGLAAAADRIGRSGLPVQQVASDPKAIYPDQQITSNIVVAPPIQPSQGRVVWEPDTPGSQTGTLRGTLHTGVDAGTSLGPGQLLISKNGEYLDIPVTKNGNDYVWEVPNVKSGDEIQIWQEVYFRSLKSPRDQLTVTFKGAFHPQQYPPPDAIKITPENKNKIYNGDPNPNVEHGGHGWNATNPKRNKDLFPESWTEDDIARAAIGVAKNPKPYPRQPQRDSGNYIVNGYAPGPGGGLNINVVVAPNGEIVTAYPDGGQPGVGRTGPDGRRR